MSIVEDLTGRRFGFLTVVDRADSRNGGACWRCACDCGTEVVRRAVVLKRGGPRTSCGCSKSLPNAGQFQPTHGATRGGERSREFRIWSAIKQRTANPGAHAFDRYGGRGVSLFPEWAASFEAFLADVGFAPSARHTIDRIDGRNDYEPGNVRWATYTQQNRNRGNVRSLTIDGTTKLLAEWAEEFNIPNKIAYMRIFKYGWDPVEALTTPVGSRAR